MSKLPSAASKTGANTLAKIPENSVSIIVRLQQVNLPRQAASGNNAPGSLSVIVSEPTVVPYVFIQPRARPGQQPKNKIMTPLSKDEAPDLLMLPGQNYLLSMFSPPTTLTLGNLFRLDGVYRDAYMGPCRDPAGGPDIMMTKPDLKLTCTRISAVPGDMTDEDFDEKIAFEDRSIHPERDVPGEDRLAYDVDPIHSPYYSLLTYLGVDTDEPGTLTARFMPPKEGNIPAMMYEPFNLAKGAKEPAIVALTGGSNGTDVEKAQLFIQQNMPDGTQLVFKAFTRVYQNAGLNKFQMDWKKMGHILGPNIIGKANCTINRAQTKELEEEDNKEIAGVLALNVVVRPDMAAMSRKMGFKISWKSCVEFDERLKNPDSLISEDPQVRINDATALNILRYSGNASLLPKAADRGWVDFYVWTNMPIDDERRDELMAMTEAQLVSEFKNKKFYGGLQPYINIFAIPTDECQCKLSELVSNRNSPSATLLFDTELKRVKVDE